MEKNDLGTLFISSMSGEESSQEGEEKEEREEKGEKEEEEKEEKEEKGERRDVMREILEDFYFKPEEVTSFSHQSKVFFSFSSSFLNFFLFTIYHFFFSSLSLTPFFLFTVNLSDSNSTRSKHPRAIAIIPLPKQHPSLSYQIRTSYKYLAKRTSKFSC